MELSGQGVQWSNIWTNPTNVGLSMGESLIMLLVDTIMYGTLAYYLDNVLPSEHGNRKHPLFFLKPSFWNQKAIHRRKQGENFANVNGTFVNDCDSVESSMKTLNNDETTEKVRAILGDQSLPSKEEKTVEDNQETKAEDISQGQIDTQTSFLPSYGIITKKGQVNLNNTFVIGYERPTEESTDPTHMEITFPKLNEKPRSNTNGHVGRNFYEDDIEPVSGDLVGKEAIVIQNMSKTFSACRKPQTTALEKVNLTIYEGQITAILGKYLGTFY